jgi:glutamate synthase (NADPH) large chain
VREEGQRRSAGATCRWTIPALGPTARSAEPLFRQAFIGRAAGLADDMAFERKLYVIRMRIEHAIWNSDLGKIAVLYPEPVGAHPGVQRHAHADPGGPMFRDLADPAVESALALVHSRFSTNTFPSWPLAHPFRYIAHNGEINTLRGNINWMRAREALCASPLFGDDLKKILPIVMENGSDSATFDNVLEFLHMAGRELPHAVLMMIPEAWSGHEAMDDDRKAFYEYHGCLMEPWDGPASIAFTDGSVIGAILDRNGLRPSRYYVTKDGLVVMASEVGVLDIPPENVLIKERLHPGRIFLVDTREGRIIDDAELKQRYTSAQPYREWLKQNLVPLDQLPPPPRLPEPDHASVLQRQQAFGYTHEDLRILMAPMAQKGEEPVGSMGNDAALAVLSDRPRLLYDYFKQLFAQVTNPPLDAIREELVTQIETPLGPESNLLQPGPESCRMLKLKTAILSNEELAKIRHLDRPGFKTVTLPMLFPAGSDGQGLARALDELCRQASEAIAGGATFIILSDRGVDAQHMPIPALLATAGVHHHLVRAGTRVKVGLIVESGEPRETHHMALLLGYGAGAINPYLAFETLDDMIRSQLLNNLDHAQAVRNYIKALNKGVVKVISKMGISTIQSYRGAQIFEAIGLDRPSWTSISPGPPRASAASASAWWRRKRPCAITAPSPTDRWARPNSTGADTTSGAATASTTCSIRTPWPGCNTPRAPIPTRSSRSFHAPATTARSIWRRCAGSWS